MAIQELNAYFRLVGDEDCGVGINCNLCDRGGAPVAYYEGISSAYSGTDVVVVKTISALIFGAQYHLARHHGETIELQED